MSRSVTVFREPRRRMTPIKQRANGPSSIVRLQQFLKASSPPKPLGQCGPNLAGMFLGGPLQKLFTEFDSIKTLVAMARKWNFLSNSLNIFSSGTAYLILKKFHRNVPWVTLFKNFSRNFDPSTNMALVNGGFLHCTDMKKFLKILLLLNHWSEFEIIPQQRSLSNSLQKLFVKF